jgi:hypothetical protein
MKLARHLALAILTGMTLSVCASAGSIVDRVVTNINGHVVLQSDWEEEVAFEALANGRAPDSFSVAERNAALERLIDQELLREQVRPSSPAPSEEVVLRLAEIRKLNPGCETEAGWHGVLQRFGLTETALRRHLDDEIQLMQLVEDRLRPSIQIDQKAVETYYNDRLLPELKQAGTKAKPLTEMYGRIRTLLAEQKMNELLSGWLASLRSGSHIRTPESSAGEGNP